MPVISDKSLGYLIVCKLTPGADYSGLRKAISRFHHHQLIDGVWMIRTKEAAAWIYRCIYKRLQPADHALVFEITDQGVWGGDMPTETARFIKDVAATISPERHKEIQQMRREIAAEPNDVVLAYCARHGIAIPVGFGRIPARRYAVVRHDTKPAKLVALTWFRTTDVVRYIQQSLRPELGAALAESIRILDFQDGEEFVITQDDQLKRVGSIEPAHERNAV